MEYTCTDMASSTIELNSRTDEASADSAGSHRRTPLHNAAMKGDVGSIATALNNGSDVNTKDAQGNTALLLLGMNFISGSRGRDRDSAYQKCIQTLLNAKADVNVLNGSNETSFHHAATLRHFEVMKALLGKRGDGFKPNTLNKDGFAPLHISAMEGDTRCIKLLLEHGAHLGSTTKDGQSAAILILKLEHGEEILSQHFDAAITTKRRNPVEGTKIRNFTFDYSSLLCDKENDKSKQMGVIEDILTLRHNLQTEELLQHPLVESFLLFKWFKAKLIFSIFIALYFILVMGVTIFVFSHFVPKSGKDNNCTDMELESDNITNVGEELINYGTYVSVLYFHFTLLPSLLKLF